MAPSDAAPSLRDEVYGCDVCSEARFAFSRPAPGRPYFKFPPTIGAPGKAPLLFIGLNPRRSRSNERLHDVLMSDPAAFEALARNRVGDQRYIRRGGTERHYRAHLDIVESVFPGQAFEEVAVATELFLCATEDGKALSVETSPCAARYLHRTVRQVEPKVILALGKTVSEFLRGRAFSDGGATFTVALGGHEAPVVTIPHPNSWGPKRERMDVARLRVAELLDRDAAPLPPDEEDDIAAEGPGMTARPAQSLNARQRARPRAPSAGAALGVRLQRLASDIDEAFGRFFKGK